MSAERGEHGFNDITDGMTSVATAAHELKSPLVLIRQLSLMLEEGDLSPREQKRMLTQVRLTSEKALRLTSDLTKSIKLSEAMFKMEPINPQQLCEDVVHELAPIFAAHNRNIKLVNRKHPLLLVANRDLLRRVIMNFSDNALNYSDAGTPVEIQLGLQNFGQTVRLGVRDYGPTLPSNTLSTLTEKLGNNVAILSRPQSSGLGLHIARQFADVMSGKIGVTRHRDGSTFYIDLPASQQLSLL